jgi:hypothetical protein
MAGPAAGARSTSILATQSNIKIATRLAKLSNVLLVSARSARPLAPPGPIFRFPSDLEIGAHKGCAARLLLLAFLLLLIPSFIQFRFPFLVRSNSQHSFRYIPLFAVFQSRIIRDPILQDAFHTHHHPGPRSHLRVWFVPSPLSIPLNSLLTTPKQSKSPGPTSPASAATIISTSRSRKP